MRQCAGVGDGPHSWSGSTTPVWLAVPAEAEGHAHPSSVARPLRVTARVSDGSFRAARSGQQMSAPGRYCEFEPESSSRWRGANYLERALRPLNLR